MFGSCLEQLIKPSEDFLIDKIDKYSANTLVLYSGKAIEFNSLGKFSGFKGGYANDSVIENVNGFEFQYRAGQHENHGNDHINIDIINPLPGTKEISKILDKIHINTQ